MATKGRIILITHKTVKDLFEDSYDLVVSRVIPSDAYWEGTGGDIVLNCMEKYQRPCDIMSHTHRYFRKIWCDGNFDSGGMFYNIRDIKRSDILKLPYENEKSLNRFMDYIFIKNCTDEPVDLILEDNKVFTLHPNCITIASLNSSNLEGYIRDEPIIPYRFKNSIDYKMSTILMLQEAISSYNDEISILQESIQETLRLIDDRLAVVNEEEGEED